MIGVVGLGKLGLPLAAIFSGFKKEVRGVDLDENIVDKINDRICPYQEPNLQEMLAQFPFRASTKYELIKDCELIFIVLPTPSTKEGIFSDEYVGKAIKEINLYNKVCRVISIVSTVSPGTCKLLQEISDIPICYNPSLIAIGRIINDLMNPDFMLIGANKKSAGDYLEKFWANIIPIQKIKRMNWINAEIAKIGLNVFLTHKMNFANMIGEVCENVEGGDVDDVLKAIGEDKRVGLSYLKSGMAYGGPCFPRDNRAFFRSMKRLGLSFKICQQVDRVNRRQHKRIFKILGDIRNKKICLLGMSYKPNTPNIEESPSVYLKNEIEEEKGTVSEYDLLIYPNKSVEESVKDCDAVIICHPTIFLNSGQLKSMKRKLVIDCWRSNHHLKKEKGIEYRALGLNE